MMALKSFISESLNGYMLLGHWKFPRTIPQSQNIVMVGEVGAAVIVNSIRRSFDDDRSVKDGI